MFLTGRNLKYGAWNPDGTQVTAPTTTLAEYAATGYYYADNANIASGDIVRVTDDVYGFIGGAEYNPQTSVIGGTVTNTFDEIQPPAAQVFTG